MKHQKPKSYEPVLIELPAETRPRKSCRKLEIIMLEGVSDFELTIAENVQNIEEIMPVFEKTLGEMQKDIGCPLTLQNIELLLVPKEELRPKTRKETLSFVRRYGEYMRYGGAGDCTSTSDGNHKLRVLLTEKQGTSPPEIVLRLAAHEYGHTIGKSLNPTRYEELKADAFASLFERFYSGESSYEETTTRLHPDRPHDQARHMLRELLRAGIHEGAIISQLLKKPFGRFKPKDYLNSIRNA